jgi:hypothetical protein
MKAPTHCVQSITTDEVFVLTTQQTPYQSVFAITLQQ